MAKITFKGNPIETVGSLPSVGTQAPEFTLVRKDLSDATLDSFEGKAKVLNVFISLDTGTCAASVKEFNHRAAQLKDVVVLHISIDLPFAQSRFCKAETINNSEALSAFRSDFPIDYGLEITSGPLAGLCSRAVIVLDKENRVIYAEQVPEITEEPNYSKVLKVLGA